MQLAKVLSRSTTRSGNSMWGTLHTDESGAMVGWVVDSWTERGATLPLQPQMHWVAKEDGKFYRMRFNIDFRSSIEVFGEDTDIEPKRAEFIRATLATWEREYLDGKQD